VIVNVVVNVVVVAHVNVDVLVNVDAHVNVNVVEPGASGNNGS
jgi:hypothetical protein